MATTQAATRLTEAHRLAQARLGTTTAAQLIQVWPLLDYGDLDGTAARWLTAAKAIITTQHRNSAQLAAQYLRAFRTLELGTVDRAFTPFLSPGLPDEQVTTSLLVTGPIKVKTGVGRGIPLVDIVEKARPGSAAAGLRLALTGGRDTIITTTRRDPQCHGWARVTSGRCCAFCAMLAGRGPVYSEGSSHFDAHDSCNCTAEPVYAGTGWNAQSRRYETIYRQAAHDATREGPIGPNGLLNAFRRAYEGQAA